MKKEKKSKQNNLVAKHAAKFNRCSVHRDKKNDYSRKNKKAAIKAALNFWLDKIIFYYYDVRTIT